MAGRSGISRIDGEIKRRALVDIGFPDLDKVLGNPCAVIGGVYRKGVGLVSDHLGKVGCGVLDDPNKNSGQQMFRDINATTAKMFGGDTMF